MNEVPDARWVKRCDTALREHGPSGGPLTIAHILADSTTEFRYYLSVDSEGSRAATGTPDSPTVTFRQSPEVAAAIRAGTLAAGEAVLLGKVSIVGDASGLIEHRRLLAEIDAVIASVG